MPQVLALTSARLNGLHRLLTCPKLLKQLALLSKKTCALVLTTIYDVYSASPLLNKLCLEKRRDGAVTNLTLLILAFRY